MYENTKCGKKFCDFFTFFYYAVTIIISVG